LPGGTLAGIAQSPEVQVFETTFSCEPNEAWFAPERSQSNPTQAEVGSYTVGKNQILLITDYSFEAYVPSSIVAHGSEPLGEKQLRGQVAYNFYVNGKMPGVTQFQIEPVPSTFQRTQFKQKGVATAADFALKRATAYGAAAGFGTALLPPRMWRHGDRGTPAVFPVRDGEQVLMRVVIYRPVGIPISLIEGRIVGYLGPASSLDRMLADIQNVGK
jgi:hypothetical protein